MLPLIRVSLAWVVGIIIASLLEPPWYVLAILAVPALGALGLYWRQPYGRWTAILVLAMLAGAVRYEVAQPTIDAAHVAFYNDRPNAVTLTGVVVDEPDIRDGYMNLRFRADSIQLDEQSPPLDVHGIVLVRAYRYPEWAYGDRLAVTGQLETPPIFDDFSYKDYLARSNIHSLMRRTHLDLLDRNQANPFWAAMFIFKRQASDTINRILSEPYASLLNGILLGIETGIPPDLDEQFNLTGTSHIIVISGSNIALLVMIFFYTGRRLINHRWALGVTIGVVIVYTFLVGADAAVSRAAVMGVFFVIGVWVGRPGMPLNSLMAAVLVLTAFNPLMLWDVGFQLSFAATLGLIVLVPTLQTWSARLLDRWLPTSSANVVMVVLNELLMLTLAAQIATAPLILYYFGRLSVVSLLSNLLILPVQPAIMVFGAAATLAGILWTPLGWLVGWLVWLPLAWTVAMVELTARMPYASLELGGVPLWLLVLVYLAIAANLWATQRTIADRPTELFVPLPKLTSLSTKLWAGGIGVVFVLLAVAAWSMPDGRLHVAFLDVGQGDAILITTPDGRQLLIDGGQSPRELTWRLGQEMPFWDRSLDMVLNTHPDFDHVGGLVAVVQRYEVGQVIAPDVAHWSNTFREWERQLTAAQIVPVHGEAGMVFDLGGDVTATLLSPSPVISGVEGLNNQSLVMHLEMGEISFLLPGDIEAPVEERLIRAGISLEATVLKSPHHGSHSSSTPAFIDAVDPQIVVISVGADNRYGHPAQAVLDRYLNHGLTIFRTDQHGTVEFSTDGVNLWVETRP